MNCSKLAFTNAYFLYRDDSEKYASQYRTSKIRVQCAYAYVVVGQ